VAISGADLWDGSIVSPINRTESGAGISTGFEAVWTGTFSDGTSGGTLALGGSDFAAIFGFPNDTDSSWLHEDAEGRTVLFRIYGYSSVLTVPGATTVVPEPTSLTLVAVGLAGLAGSALLRRRGASPPRLQG
jgi:MYXO-CTERM domain-containing protein